MPDPHVIAHHLIWVAYGWWLPNDPRGSSNDATQLLEHPLRTFTPAMIACVAEALGAEITAHRYTCRACAIMPDHVHVIILKHKHGAEEMIANLQRASHPLAARACVRRPRSSGVGRSRVERVPRPPGRRVADDSVRRGASGARFAPGAPQCPSQS